MRKFSFIHTSDVHLGHQQFNLEERFHDFGRAFRRVVDYALANRVDFVVIGGDFFHKRAINAETLRQAMELLEPLKTAGIRVIAIEGNHDKAFYQDRSSWLKLLNSLGYLSLLKPEFTDGRLALNEWKPEGEGCVLETDTVRFIGLGYLGATTEQRLNEAAELIEPSDRFTIMVLHGAVNKMMGQDLGGIRTEVLDRFRDRVDYLALGHIHSRDEDGWYFNPGSLENCHIDEAGEGKQKGFYHVSVTGPDTNVRYIPAEQRPVRLCHVDITGSADPDDVAQRVRDAFTGLKLTELDRPMVQVILRGELEFSALAVDAAALAKEIKDTGGCLYVEVQNRVNTPGDGDLTDSGEGLHRTDIEKRVFGSLLARRYPQHREIQDDLVNLILKVKESALGGENAADILAAVSALAGMMPDPEIQGAEIQDAVTETAAGEGDDLADTEA